MISWQINFFNFLLSKINRNRNIYLSIYLSAVLARCIRLRPPPPWSWSTPDWSSSLNVFPFQSPLQTCVNKYTCSRILSHSFTLTVGSQYSPLYIQLSYATRIKSCCRAKPTVQAGVLHIMSGRATVRMDHPVLLQYDIFSDGLKYFRGFQRFFAHLLA